MEHLFRLRLLLLKAPIRLTVYGVQVEKGKISTGIVSPHINDIGIPNGSIRPEHFSPSAGIPPGAVMAFAMQAPPIGWLVCDGRAVNRTQYKNLFNAIGTTFWRRGWVYNI